MKRRKTIIKWRKSKVKEKTVHSYLRRFEHLMNENYKQMRLISECLDRVFMELRVLHSAVGKINREQDDKALFEIFEAYRQQREKTQ